ncbi:hypothetical protein Tco_1098698 [Tanacetum coccineum]
MLPPNNLGPNESGVSINDTLFRGMIGSLMYLIARRIDIQFSTCIHARYQANPKESHLVVVKRIFRKSTLGGYQILSGKLVYSSVKKQSSVEMSLAEAEYVPIFCDNTSAIAISNNPVLHSRTKHIQIRYHFIKDHILKGDIELHFVPIDLQLANIFTKPLAEPRFTRLVAELGMLNIEKQVPDKKEALSDAGLATMGISDEKHPNLSSINIINLSPGSQDQLNVNQQTIAYCLCWGLEFDIANILFSDLIASLHPTTAKPKRKANISSTFKPTLKNEVALMTHMCKVTALSPDPIKTLLPSSRGVNDDETTDKETSPSLQVAETQPAEETVATADATQSLDASESTKEKLN